MLFYLSVCYTTAKAATEFRPVGEADRELESMMWTIDTTDACEIDAVAGIEY